MMGHHIYNIISKVSGNKISFYYTFKFSVSLTLFPKKEERVNQKEDKKRHKENLAKKMKTVRDKIKNRK